MSMPVRILILVLLLGVFGWLCTWAPGNALLIGSAAGVVLGGLIIWLFKIWPAQARLQLLFDGKHEEYHRANDATLARTKNPKHRAILLMNRAAAYAQSGEFERGVAVYDDEIDASVLKGVTRDLYVVNFLTLLAHCDADRAEELVEQNSQLFDEEAPPRLRGHVEDAMQTYRLMALGDDSGEDWFRQQSEATTGVQQAFARYHLAVLLARRGETAEADRIYREGQSAWPALRVPNPATTND